MKAIRFTNAMNHEQIINLSNITGIEKSGSQSTLVFSYGKDHAHVNLKSVEERDELFEKISKLLDAE